MISKSALKRRYRRQQRLVWYGRGSIGLALVFLLGLLGSVAVTGAGALFSAQLSLNVSFDPQVIGAQGQNNLLAYERLAKIALRDEFSALGDNSRRQRRELDKLMSFGAAEVLRSEVAAVPGVVGTTQQVWLPASALAEEYLRDPALGATGQLSAVQAGTLQQLAEQKRLRRVFNTRFFSAGDSRDPELAGIGGAFYGTLLTLLVTFVISFPLALGAAVYLEMFAPRSRWFDFIEININNLAAVPSIVMGLLGLAVFINLFGVPRSTPLVGGLVLALMTLPTIIIAARASLKAVPPSLLSGALALGATRLQAVFHHVLPLAMPGILTGTIIGMAQALGETAPLLMIGMVAFIAELPGGFVDAATVLPVQIFLWADSPERGFAERAALAICVLLLFLLLMNALAIFLRRRLELKW